jgi:hypothetical protein
MIVGYYNARQQRIDPLLTCRAAVLKAEIDEAPYVATPHRAPVSGICRMTNSDLRGTGTRLSIFQVFPRRLSAVRDVRNRTKH